MSRDEIYTCHNCHQTKKDSDSRYSLVIKDTRNMTRETIAIAPKKCWECTRIAEAKQDRKKILLRISQLYDRFDDTNNEIEQYKKEGGVE